MLKNEKFIQRIECRQLLTTMEKFTPEHVSILKMLQNELFASLMRQANKNK